MRGLRTAFLLRFVILAGMSPAFAKVVVFWQEGFPAVGSQPVTRAALAKALEGTDPVFAGVDGLQHPETFTGADLLVLPYGSATPADAWGGIQGFIRGGGNVLVLGGQPGRVPVTGSGQFVQGPPQDTYARDLGFQHSYELPRVEGARFAWRTGYSFLGAVAVRASRFFALEGRVNGLGYMENSEGLAVAAPVVVTDRVGGGFGGGRGAGAGGAASRMVMLDFDPVPGYWESGDGIALIRITANYARQGPSTFTLEMPFSTIKADETPKVAIHLRNSGKQNPGEQEVKIELLSGNAVIDTVWTPVFSGSQLNADAAFSKTVPPGFYTVRGEWLVDKKPREFYQNGFWVEDEKLLTSGPALGVKGDFITRDGKPFFPVGANYFSTEANGWDFSGPRNAWIWERDFEEMQRYGVSFVRTGVWSPQSMQLDPATKTVTERFLRNLEAYLLSAHRHGIAVNFTFYAFAPRPLDMPPAPATPAPTPAIAGAGRGGRGGAAPQPPPGPNVYMDPDAITSELHYVLAVVNRFKDVPWLCYDLINEPSFSNPNRLWKGNTPNGDPVELSLWHKWLRARYPSVQDLGAAWWATPEQLQSFDNVPLPSQTDLAFDRAGRGGEVRALDYNLFAQDKFTDWVRAMVTAIRGTGSRQLINVGQDEGGVTDRVLNQFYAAGGVSFTTNHTYWRDDGLLWDSVAAKRPGVPNIVGETGYQPVKAVDGAWRYDELTGSGLNERKWALGFAVANSGALMWDWDREVDFGIKRSDGSAKILQGIMRGIGQFAEKAAPYATEVIAPQVAIVLPQSMQLSVLNATALEAQQRSVRALFQYARAEAYAVGEYQIELLGNPKLIILPSPMGLTASAWEAIRGKVQGGATLLVSGPFDGDAHFHPTGRQKEIGLAFETGPLTTRENLLKWPGGEARLTYQGDKTTFLDRAVLPDGSAWAEKALGKGRILFSPLPLELNNNEQAVGDIYRYALKTAGVAPTYSTSVQDPGILICPTRYPRATLYVLTSEAGQQVVSFRDQRSGKSFSGTLEPGRAALLLVGDDGGTLAAYNWKAR